jgi:hypothetical protein
MPVRADDVMDSCIKNLAPPVTRVAIFKDANVSSGLVFPETTKADILY